MLIDLQILRNYGSLCVGFAFHTVENLQNFRLKNQNFHQKLNFQLFHLEMKFSKRWKKKFLTINYRKKYIEFLLTQIQTVEN